MERAVDRKGEKRKTKEGRDFPPFCRGPDRMNSKGKGRESERERERVQIIKEMGWVSGERNPREKEREWISFRFSVVGLCGQSCNHLILNFIN
jgi:hypothetical protein